MNSARRSPPSKVAAHGILITYTIIALFPVLLILINSFKDRRAVFQSPLALPGAESVSLIGYTTVLEQGNFTLYFFNSFVVTVVALILVLILGAMAAFALAEYRFPFNPPIMGLHLAIGIMIPIRLGTVVMHEGVVQQVGSPTDLYRRPANLFVAGFIGSPKMNFLERRAAEAGRVDLARGGALPVAELQRPVGEVVLGVRPDGIALGSNETAPLRGKVVLNEYPGCESYLHLEFEEGSRIVVDVPAENRVRLDEVVGLVLGPRAAQLFDAGSEQQLATRGL